MKQHHFEARHEQDWRRFAEQLARLEQPRKKAPSGSTPLAEFPEAYRRLCQQLSLARERQYSAHLVDRLNQLALRAHQQLYRAPVNRWQAMLRFLTGGFPRLLRAEWHLFGLATACFALPLLGMGIGVYLAPEWIYTLLDHRQVADLEAMYRPGGHPGRGADSDLLMFGFYIFNNIGIGFRTFAAGILFGVGSIMVLLLNGLYIGAVVGYLAARGFGGTLFPFLIAHGAFELTGIVVAGAAGLRLGRALLSPGCYTRMAALRRAARPAVHLVYGMIMLLLVAAFMEAFWSSSDQLPPGVRYGVGAACWVAVLGYLALAGRRAA